MSVRHRDYAARLRAAKALIVPVHPSHPLMPDAPGFDFRCLSVMSYALGSTVWQYTDRNLRLRDIMRKGFLNAAASRIATGDAVLAIAADRTTWLCVVRFEQSGLVLTWAR